jgi:hypothetical protein
VVIWRRWLVGFVNWWWWVLQMWNLVIQWRWRRWIDIVLVVQLLGQRFLHLVLLLAEALNLMLDSGQLCFCRCFILEGFVFPIFHLDLLKLYIFVDDLYWRRCM